MSEVALKFKLLHPHAQLPRKRPGDAGYDLFLPEDLVIDPMSQALANLGIASEFPEMWVAQILDRSSVARKGCHIVAGTVDSIYRGEWSVLLWNLGDKPVGFSVGERIAQFLLLPIVNLIPREVSELGTTERGAGSWGSTGR